MGKWKSRPPLAAMPDATAAAIAQVEQNQRAFQKQDCIFVGKKRVLGKAKKGIRESRYFKSVGLGIKTPRAAIDGTYVDRKCPWTGNVNIRGKLITGMIKTTKMKNTVSSVRTTCTTSLSTTVSRSATRTRPCTSRPPSA